MLFHCLLELPLPAGSRIYKSKENGPLFQDFYYPRTSTVLGLARPIQLHRNKLARILRTKSPRTRVIKVARTKYRG